MIHLQNAPWCCRFTGPNNVMHDTMAMFMHPRFGVKESQALAKIPDTLVFAMEFLTMPVPAVSAIPRSPAVAPPT